MSTAKQLRQRYWARETTKKVIKSLAITGGVIIAAQSRYFIRNVIRYYKKYGWQNIDDKKQKQLTDTFTYLKNKNLIKIDQTTKQIKISLTPEGRKRAKYFQIDKLTIAQPKKWDGKWRILLFDIPEKAKIKRESLRNKLKDLNFYLLQKSVWVYPYKCDEELKLLRDFFGLKNDHYLLIESENLGGQEEKIKKHFNLKI